VRDADADNRLTIVAVVAERSEIRYTPAGVPVVELALDHRSTQDEAGHPRRVECRLRAKALGETARALTAVPVGTTLRCGGFIARRHRAGTEVNDNGFP
jgi:primosomal replication protein N